MKNPGWIVLIGATALLGCNRASDTGSSSASTDQNPPPAQNTAVTPASRPGESSRTYSGDTNSSQYNADNTGKNVRDRSDSSLTSGDQANNDADLQLTTRIRKAINDDNQLSTTAKNIKVITQNGKVTLRGPVSTPEEQKTISSIIQKLGISNVDDQLEVKRENQ
jgi:hyperosmotically inducible protein